jgi:predicted transposase YbfD/YdcC
MLPVGDGSDEVKQTNEIKYAPLLLDTLDITDKDITSDALHTQTEFADYLVEQRHAHYFFCVKKNQRTLFEDIDCYFIDKQQPADHEDKVTIAHGRVEIRRIWVTTELNDYVAFPHVAQAYKIEREIMDKKTGKISIEIAYGVTSRKTEDISAKKI